MTHRAVISSSEAARKAVHIGTGLLAFVLPWLTRWQAAGICALSFLMNWQVLPRVTRHHLEREEEKRGGIATGIVLYPIAVGALFVLFGSRMEVAAAAWGILAFGDGFATVAGKSIGGPRLSWNSGKTLSGLLAFVIAGGLYATIVWLWVASQSPAGPVADSACRWLTVALACFAAAMIGALVESYPSGINDNISVPLASGGFLFALSFAGPEQLHRLPELVAPGILPAVAVNLVVSGLAWAARSVKPSGAAAGFFIGVITCAFGGWRAYVILLLFFVLATGATKVGFERKAARRIAQEEGGRRSARHAVANCGVPAFAAFLSAVTPHERLFLIGLAAALATAAFDTVSSELGQVYGRHPFLITSFKRVPAGTDGAVSVEGTLAGLAAAGVLALSALGFGMMGSSGWKGASAVVAGAFAGTTFESYLGAISRGSGAASESFVDNEAMNFINTLVGALVAMGLFALVSD
jgi:uncharacterized protein (TIGR00297 family)